MEVMAKRIPVKLSNISNWVIIQVLTGGYYLVILIVLVLLKREIDNMAATEKDTRDKQEKPNYDMLFETAIILFKSKKYKEAYKIFSQCYQLSGGNIDKEINCVIGAAFCFEAAANREKALQVMHDGFREIRKNHPDNNKADNEIINTMVMKMLETVSQVTKQEKEISRLQKDLSDKERRLSEATVTMLVAHRDAENIRLQKENKRLKAEIRKLKAEQEKSIHNSSDEETPKSPRSRGRSRSGLLSRVKSGKMVPSLQQLKP